MRLEFGQEGKTTQFVIVNKSDATDQEDQQALINRTLMPIFQDVASADVWGGMNGAKDDFYIYNQSGLLTKHIRQRTEPTKLNMPEDYARLKSEIIAAEASH